MDPLDKLLVEVKERSAAIDRERNELQNNQSNQDVMNIQSNFDPSQIQNYINDLSKYKLKL